MIDIKCCNIAMLVHPSGKVEPILTDIETGRRCVLYGGPGTIDELNNMFRKMYAQCTEKIGVIPSTFIFVGEWGYYEDLVIFECNHRFIGSFMKNKTYACYMEIDKKAAQGAIFRDRITDKIVDIVDVPMDFYINTRMFVESVKLSGYGGYRKLGDDSIIISGPIKAIDKNVSITAAENNIMMGTADGIFESMITSICGGISDFGDDENDDR